MESMNKSNSLFISDNCHEIPGTDDGPKTRREHEPAPSVQDTGKSNQPSTSKSDWATDHHDQLTDERVKQIAMRDTAPR
jgi:hypothetical protein